MTGPESIAPERHWARYYELSGSRTTRRVIREKLIAATVDAPQHLVDQHRSAFTCHFVRQSCASRHRRSALALGFFGLGTGCLIYGPGTWLATPQREMKVDATTGIRAEP